MKKSKKIATAVVSMVMAGTMVCSFAACGPKDTGNDIKQPNTNAAGELAWSDTTQVRLNLGYNSASTGIAFDANGNLPYENAGSSVVLPDGKAYAKGAMKPATATIEKNLKIDLVNAYQAEKTSATLVNAISQNKLANYDIISANVTNIMDNKDKLLDIGQYVDYMPNFKNFIQNNKMIELSISDGINKKTNKSKVYYAPYFDGFDDIENYNLFRKDYVSELLVNANLTNASTKNGGTITYAAQATAKAGTGYDGTETYDGTKASVNAYMGPADWTIETTNPGKPAEIITVKVVYSKVKTALSDTGTGIGKAVQDAVTALGDDWDASKAGTLTASGNIVDIQNYLINGSAGKVKGADLLNVLREYVKVAYEYNDKSFYDGAEFGDVTTKLSDVFNEAWAAWDVDLYVALARCYVTCGNLLGEYQSGDHAKTLFAFVPRQEALNRTTSYYRLIGQLYGVRGLESRLGHSYVDASGNLRDARYNAATWEAIDNFSQLTKEGLVTSMAKTTGTYCGSMKGSSSCSTQSFYDGSATHLQGLMSYDYVQTQTATGYVLDGMEIAITEDNKPYLGSEYVQTTDGYNYAPVVTPVSRYNVEGDTSTVEKGAIKSSYDSLSKNTTIMRFTESWRSVKTAGICIPATTADDPEKLAATLTYLDYLYSNDGRIISSYGPMAEQDSYTGDVTTGFTSNCGGFWYGTPVTEIKLTDSTTYSISGKSMSDLAEKGIVATYDGKQYHITDEYASQAFVFENKLYTGTEYNGGYVPTITTATMKAYLGYQVNGGKVSSSKGSYTSFAQQVLGTCVGFAEKMQSFEYQCTSAMGLAGAKIVGTAIGNGTIKHVQVAVDQDNWWWTISPSGLPLSSNQSKTITGYNTFNTLFQADSSTFMNLFLEVARFGLSGTDVRHIITSMAQTDTSTAVKMVAAVKEWAPAYENYYNSAWSTLKSNYLG